MFEVLCIEHSSIVSSLYLIMRLCLNSGKNSTQKVSADIMHCLSKCHTLCIEVTFCMCWKEGQNHGLTAVFSQK